ncbi:P-loop containing nucleoside triphosphate hydrolase protein [Amylocarpus encephaloides]|uniref:RNA helicase n=1 Tax=Amylocarpus encephaloides TaxID=45428 RepID=A0A9P7YHS9_9HELO|nr:P-loop containing nucleoside triphosphate hydrolase protein [Amylocarpus encephaloides]
MSLAIRRAGRCAFCTFRVSEQSTPSLLQWHIGAKRRRSVRSSGGSRSTQLRSAPPRAEQFRPPSEHKPRNHDSGPSSKGFERLLLEELRRHKSYAEDKANNDSRIWQLTHAEARNARKLLAKQLSHFETQVKTALARAREHRNATKENNTLYFYLRQAFVDKDMRGLGAEMRYRFHTSNFETEHQSSHTVELQQALADLTHPLEWFPGTRAMQRTIHLHIGPTNSGKTYHALKRLEAAKSGIYAGPLRLLAHEVYSRFNAKGKKCALITGEEQRIPEGLNTVMNSCTVEMVPLNAQVEVAVIDEIQMLGDSERGWAWTQAFVGVQAKEVHLCGEVRVESLIRSMCEAMGDKLVIHRYERLGLLKVEPRPVGFAFDQLKKGDALILFSRVQIHAMKKEIEKKTGKRVAVVYGSLPPETRAAQAALFNDPDNDYDFLVASNAIGMGLNLSVKRIIFEATAKHDGIGKRRLETSEIKQIAGRAGRFKSAHSTIQQGTDIQESTKLDVDQDPNVEATTGYVTAMHKDDLAIINKAMHLDAPPLKTAGLFPAAEIMKRFTALFPAATPFSYIVLRLQELAKLHPQYHLCGLRDQILILDLIQPFKISIDDRIVFMSAPINVRRKDPLMSLVVVELAQCLANQTSGELLDLKSLPLYMLDQDIHDHPLGTKGYLGMAEAFHQSINLYLWLSYRFSGVFRSQSLAFHVKRLIEAKIDECLAEVQWQAHLERGYSRKLEAQGRLKDELSALETSENSIGNALEGDDEVEAEDMLDENDAHLATDTQVGAVKSAAGESTLVPEDGNIPVPPLVAHAPESLHREAGV